MTADQAGEDQGDPVHDAGPTSAVWTTVNAAEAIPGVATPLGWTWFFEGCELGLRGAFADIGAIPGHEVRVFPDLDDRFIGIFYGHFAGNLDMMRKMGDQMPGSSGDAVEEQYFAQARNGAPKRRSMRRVPVVALKLPVHAWLAQRRIRRLRDEVDRWWRHAVTPGSTVDDAEARRYYRDAKRYWLAVCRPHTVVSMVGQGLYEQVRRACEAAGKPGLELRIVSASRDVFETQLIVDLWDVANGRRTLEAFLADHGFHGPAEGELSSRSWREDPSQIESLLDAYRERERPDQTRGRPDLGRSDAEAEILAACGRLTRLRVRLIVGLARRFIPMREEGRATFLKAYDVARCMARRIGDDFTERGLLDERDDVFFLTDHELLDIEPTDARSVIAFRRERHRRYQRLELPERWQGKPEPVPLDPASVEPRPDGDLHLAAVGASAGTVEGRAVVVIDPAEPGELQSGDILVCHTTDPSWVSLFFVVSACVIDIGGPMSHGAIVARELNLPCVIGTRDGTRRLRTGDIIRVDGSTGTVDVLTMVRG